MSENKDSSEKFKKMFGEMGIKPEDVENASHGIPINTKKAPDTTQGQSPATKYTSDEDEVIPPGVAKMLERKKKKIARKKMKRQFWFGLIVTLLLLFGIWQLMSFTKYTSKVKTRVQERINYAIDQVESVRDTINETRDKIIAIKDGITNTINQLTALMGQFQQSMNTLQQSYGALDNMMNGMEGLNKMPSGDINFNDTGNSANDSFNPLNQLMNLGNNMNQGNSNSFDMNNTGNLMNPGDMNKFMENMKEIEREFNEIMPLEESSPPSAATRKKPKLP